VVESSKVVSTRTNTIDPVKHYIINERLDQAKGAGEKSSRDWNSINQEQIDKRIEEELREFRDRKLE
jgi:hypothetical protein